ncbi:MAG: hypothetical protein N3J91_14480, partial [Verrucomicrobiae bacterium]|nr:hypothetical protein [Verrucomicrobiae bacterium]
DVYKRQGEIAYIQAGTRYNAPARTEDGQAVAAGQLVRIKRVVGTQFYVEPLNQKAAGRTGS